MVASNISLTCDAWQAANTDAYFAVTGHWVEECTPGTWALEGALLGFTQMNCAHDGKHLGQMLYKICNRLQIVHKVSTIIFELHSMLNGFMPLEGWSHHLRQHQEQLDNVGRVRWVLQLEDRAHIRHQAASYQVRPIANVSGNTNRLPSDASPISSTLQR